MKNASNSETFYLFVLISIVIVYSYHHLHSGSSLHLHLLYLHHLICLLYHGHLKRSLYIPCLGLVLITFIHLLINLV